MKEKRLIDANKLKIHYAWWDDDERRNLFDQIVDAQPTADTEPHWIPVSERLPEVRQWVLCQCRAGIMDVLRLTEDGSWYKGYPNTEYMGGFVVAWMPLPEPYEVKE